MNGQRADMSRKMVKAIDGRILVDLLARLTRFTSLEGYAFAGMSDFALEDHRLVNRRLGLDRLLSFDDEKIVVDRQRFNKPTENTRCTIRTLTDFGQDWPTVIAEEGLDDARGYILSIRQNDPENIGQQIREFSEIAGSLPLHGVIRVLLKLDFDAWAGPQSVDGKPQTLEARQARALIFLKDQIGDFIDARKKPKDLAGLGLAKLLTHAYGSAAARTVGTATGNVLEPLSVTLYSGVSAYLSITGIVIRQAERRKLRNKMSSNSWAFISQSWDDLNEVVLSELSTRETLAIEYSSARGKDAVDSQLGFDIDEATGETGFFKSFVSVYPYLPKLLMADI